ncbi:hypothetical protein Gotri_007603 [Gossypium trilobum]|uniref:Uncharacterized protein n=3 Tax=Gossypium TaxID=3633 RepID=A0A7J9EI78_9ROSI|nr:hypothetical protein [Gossypium trilobum]
MSTLNGFNAYVTDAPALESSLTSFKGKNFYIYF